MTREGAGVTGDRPLEQRGVAATFHVHEGAIRVHLARRSYTSAD